MELQQGIHKHRCLVKYQGLDILDVLCSCVAIERKDEIIHIASCILKKGHVNHGDIKCLHSCFYFHPRDKMTKQPYTMRYYLGNFLF